jgi:hypothetical protein
MLGSLATFDPIVSKQVDRSRKDIQFESKSHTLFNGADALEKKLEKLVRD